MRTNRTLADLIGGFVERGDRPAVLAVGRAGVSALSYAALEDRTMRVAGGLAAAGVRKGDRIALYAHNRPEWIVACLAVLVVGGVVVPLDTRLGKEALAREVRHSAAGRIFVSRTLVEPLREALGGKEVPELIAIDGEGDFADGTTLDALAGERLRGPPELTEDDTAALFYTSGTTGLPKGVPLTHRNILSNLEAMGREGLATPDERALLPLPLHHVYPFTVGMLVPLAGGAAIVLPADVSGPEIVRALKDTKVTIVIGVPRLYEALASAIRRRMQGRGRIVGRLFEGLLRFSVGVRRRTGWRVGRILMWPVRAAMAPALTLLASGGAALDEDTAWTLEGLGWEVLTGYGLTETSPIVAFNPRGRARLATVGRPLHNVDVRIEPVADKEGGEILVKGPSVFAGYLENRAATEKAFSHDGWFRTEDLGRLDADGYLTILARVKETIVLSDGKNVFPEEVEERYQRSPQIRELAIFEAGGRLAALAVPDAAAIRDAGGGDIAEAVRGEVRRISRDLPSYQRASDVQITRQALPRTSLGKLRRHLLSDMFERARTEGSGGSAEQALSEDDRQLVETDPARHVWEGLRNRYPDRTVTLDADLQTDLGIDSLEWVSLTLELQEEHGIRLSEDTASRIATVRELLEEAMQADAAPAEESGRPSREQERWTEPPGPVVRFIARCFQGLNRAVLRTVFRLRVEGAETVPRQGALVIAPNHLSFLDPFALGAALPAELLPRTFWAGYTGILFAGPLRRAFSRLTQTFPIDPVGAPASALALGGAVVRRGNVLVWFPEGARSRDGRMQRFTAGVGHLVDGDEASFVPVRIDGTFEAWPPGQRLPRPGRVRIRFGAPVLPSVLERHGNGSRREERIADALRTHIAALGDA